jgi:hypothetical protein
VAKGSEPLDLAFATSAAGALWLALAVALVLTANGGLAPFAVAPQGVGFLAAAVVAAFGNVIYFICFEPQRRGGIVSLSQIGYVGAGPGGRRADPRRTLRGADLDRGFRHCHGHRRVEAFERHGPV